MQNSGHRRSEKVTLSCKMDVQISKEEYKRQYNRLAQREFRKRRKEYLQNLEQAQKYKNERLEEIKCLEYDNNELRRENGMLRLELYGPSTSPRYSPIHIPFPLKTAGSPLSPRSQLGLDSSDNSTLAKWPSLTSLQYGGHPKIQSLQGQLVLYDNHDDPCHGSKAYADICSEQCSKCDRIRQSFQARPPSHILFIDIRPGKDGDKHDANCIFQC
ncbi:hypothetical protein OIDMADRAFT_32587 [Oidiodendron maius Zn]|uniref:BZIP domain-containing protein n=1 Tax=Oidiodendron maius (strain Zn) TaxID=913774 RepID=A0A0C3GZU0_OIDMZ|nr:hypothetical protein OIDMADRAFT_32587 [Oidiodendron maius Zn]